jgi:lipopolysaccharide biosynthesis protein
MKKLYGQFEYNTKPGPYHQPSTALPVAPPPQLPVKLVAYYLPQFHAIPENDKFWGEGFTEWTNTTKVLPRYVGHYQPRLPADLGFYDLSQAETIRRQWELSRRAGIYGFCIHYYWFSGIQVLDTPLKLLLENPDIDIKFFLNWANESWSRRWDGSENDILLHQRYDDGDDLRFAESILSAVTDPRYIRVNGRPVIMIYRPGVIPNIQVAINRWREFFIDKGVGNPYFIIPQAFGDNDPRKFGVDAAAGFPPHNKGWDGSNNRNFVELLDPKYEGFVESYEALVEKHKSRPQPSEFRLFPGVCPGWDNEARKIGRGTSFYGANPAKYGEWLYSSANEALKAPPDERIVFINAWNEWAEGAYLEPDRHFGFAYLAETRRVIDRLTGVAPTGIAPTTSVQSSFTTKLSRLNWLRLLFPRLLKAFRRKIRSQ